MGQPSRIARSHARARMNRTVARGAEEGPDTREVRECDCVLREEEEGRKVMPVAGRHSPSTIA